MGKRDFEKVTALLTAKGNQIGIKRDLLNILYGVWLCVAVKHGPEKSMKKGI